MSETRIQGLVRALLTHANELETAMLQVLTLRTLDTSVGVQLDSIGELLKLPRNGLDDDTYRSVLRARVLALKSSGMGDQVLLIARLVFGDYAKRPEVLAAGVMSLWAVPQPPASFLLRVENMDLTFDLAKLFILNFLERIGGVGIRAILEFDLQQGNAHDAHDDAFRTSDANGRDVGPGGGVGAYPSGAIVDVSGFGGPMGAWME